MPPLPPLPVSNGEGGIFKIDEKVRRIIFDYGSFILATVGITFAVVMYLNNSHQVPNEEVKRLNSELSAHEQVQAELVKTLQNDLHSQDQKITEIMDMQVQIQKDIVKLQTIIEERIPKK